MFACVILGLAFVTAVAGIVDPRSTSARTILPALVDDARTALAKPPVLPPMLYKTMSADEAIAYNASLPFATEPNVPARPFKLSTRSSDYARSLDCLTAAAYYEASGEGPAGEAAVAQVVLNRVRNPAFPASVCAVVYQGSTRPTGCQFTFTCDGSLLRDPNAGGWKAAQAVAAAALSGTVFAPAGLATHYHADTVVPYWANALTKSAQVGAHIFYRWPGAWGRPAAFRQHYDGEPYLAAQLRNAALVAHHIAPQFDGLPSVAVTVNEEVAKPDPLTVIALLAGSPGAPDQAKLVRANFKDEPPVVQAYRQFVAAHGNPDRAAISASLSQPSATGKDPAVDQLAAWINGFASSPGYAAFVKASARPVARHDQLSDALVPVLRDIQAYTGLSIGQVSVTLTQSAAGDAQPSAPCTVGGQPSPSKKVRKARADQSVDPLGARLGQAAADYQLWVAQTRGDSRAASAATCSSTVEQQVVAALLVRMIALRNGESAAQAQVSWEVGHGHTLVPILAQRLRAFEASRDRFVTLTSAYDTLVAGLAGSAAPVSNVTVAQAGLPIGQPAKSAGGAPGGGS